MKKNLGLIISLIAATAGIGGIGKANAASIVPTTEGEIQLTNLACLGGTVNCVDPTTLQTSYKVTTLAYDSQYGLSRLFVTTCNTNHSNLQSRHFQTRIICNYNYTSTRINCN